MTDQARPPGAEIVLLRKAQEHFAAAGRHYEKARRGVRDLRRERSYLEVLTDHCQQAIDAGGLTGVLNARDYAQGVLDRRYDLPDVPQEATRSTKKEAREGG